MNYTHTYYHIFTTTHITHMGGCLFLKDNNLSAKDNNLSAKDNRLSAKR